MFFSDMLKTLNKNYFADIVVQRLMISGDLNWFGDTHGQSLDYKIDSSIVNNYCKDYEDEDDDNGGVDPIDDVDDDDAHDDTDDDDRSDDNCLFLWR
jgi:hypothetical protein